MLISVIREIFINYAMKIHAKFIIKLTFGIDNFIIFVIQFHWYYISEKRDLLIYGSPHKAITIESVRIDITSRVLVPNNFRLGSSHNNTDTIVRRN